MASTDEISSPMLPRKAAGFSKSRDAASSVGTKGQLWASLRENPRVSYYSLALTSAILLWGYDMAMSGNLYGMDEFKKAYGQFNESEDEWSIPSMWLSLWNAASPLGIMLGALTGGWLQDRFGRRLSLGLGSMTSALGVAIVFISTYTNSGKQAVFGAGKFTQGLTIGVVVTTTQTYISEILPSKLRGPLLAFFPVFFLIGQLMSAGIVLGLQSTTGKNQYLIAIISEWPFSVIPVVLAIFMPESPAYLITQGNFAGALKAQKRLDSPHTDSRAKVSELQASIQHEEEKASASSSAYADCFKKTDFRRTRIAIFSAILPQLFGLPILGDGPYFLQKAGMDDTPSFIFLLVGLIFGVIGTITSMWLLTFVGRRKLVLASLLPLTFLWLGMGIAGSIESTFSAWYVGITTTVVTLTASLGVWPASYVITGEVSSLRLRAKTGGVAWSVGGAINLFFSMVTPFIYNDDAGDLGAKIAYIWVFICGGTFVAAWYIVPEMLDRSALQLDQMFEARIPARDFSKWIERPMTVPSVNDSKPGLDLQDTDSTQDLESMELDWVANRPRDFS